MSTFNLNIAFNPCSMVKLILSLPGIRNCASILDILNLASRDYFDWDSEVEHCTIQICSNHEIFDIHLY